MEQAGKMLATTYPALAQKMQQESATQDEKGFGDRLKNLFG